MARAKSPWSLGAWSLRPLLLSWLMRGLPKLSADHATDHSVDDNFRPFRLSTRSGMVKARRSQQRKVLSGTNRADHRSDGASAGLVFVESGRRELIHQRHEVVDLPWVRGRRDA